MSASILQLDPEIFLLTPLGEMSAFLVIDYGIHLNSMFIGSLCASGDIIHVTSEECRRPGNPTLDIPDPKPFEGRRVK